VPGDDGDRALLERYKPSLRYDRNESYFTDSAAEMTDATGNVLRTAAGRLVATAGAGVPSLMPYLVPAGRPYPGTTVVAGRGDSLGVPGRDHPGVYRAIRTREPGLRNVVYGRRIDAGRT
jgi:hypothetical protein